MAPATPSQEEQSPKILFNSRRSMSRMCFSILLLLCFTGAATSQSIVETLPGFPGKLPFKLETGYVRVDEIEIFYYFIESERNPRIDPIMLWYSGGPGCSALNGLIYEIGPLAFNITAYYGGLPSLEYYPYSWTKTASILFADVPVGTGFSYTTDPSSWTTSDTKTAQQTYIFLKKWLIDHPQFLQVQLFVGADSYSGITAPMVVQHILDANNDGDTPRLNLKGYIVGCPRTDAGINENSKINFLHRMGFISDELYESAKESCGGQYYEADFYTPQCTEDVKLIEKGTHDLDKNNILDPKCTWASPQIDGDTKRRSLEENPGNFLLSPPIIPDFWCHNFNYSLSYIWANDVRVQKALHVREGTIEDWKRCNKSIPYTMDQQSVIGFHHNLSRYGLQVLVYNGDHDLTIPNVGTQEWIELLNITVVNDWRPWLVDGEIAGYTIKYSEHGYRLTYATIKGAGHSPQEYKRRECFEMFHRFISYYPI
ncbi:hypothetical protein PVL29_003381 [Vitis rotundifolia]|nr:hypothetical protein PVL29_003381 [Vitis rotundifolia]